MLGRYAQKKKDTQLTILNRYIDLNGFYNNNNNNIFFFFIVKKKNKWEE
jgi:hypothetical protein